MEVRHKRQAGMKESDHVACRRMIDSDSWVCDITLHFRQSAPSNSGCCASISGDPQDKQKSEMTKKQYFNQDNIFYIDIKECWRLYSPPKHTFNFFAFLVHLFYHNFCRTKQIMEIWTMKSRWYTWPSQIFDFLLYLINTSVVVNGGHLSFIFRHIFPFCWGLRIRQRTLRGIMI